MNKSNEWETENEKVRVGQAALCTPKPRPGLTRKNKINKRVEGVHIIEYQSPKNSCQIFNLGLSDAKFNEERKPAEPNNILPRSNFWYKRQYDKKVTFFLPLFYFCFLGIFRSTSTFRRQFPIIFDLELGTNGSRLARLVRLTGEARAAGQLLASFSQRCSRRTANWPYPC